MKLTETIKKNIDSKMDNDIDAYFIKLENLQKIEESQIERFHIKYKNNLNYIIEKVINKYESEYYINREYRKGNMPENLLYYFLHDYAEKYGINHSNDEKMLNRYANEFSSSLYQIGDYFLTTMDGQGTVIKIMHFKYKNPF